MSNYVQQKSEDELVELGEAAEVLLQHPAFSTTVHDLTEACAGVFFMSPPDQVEQREDAYTLMRAFQEITATLRQRVDTKNQIILEREQAKLAADEDFQE